MSLKQSRNALESKSEKDKYLDQQQSIKTQLAQEKMKKTKTSKVAGVGKAIGKGIIKILDEK